MHQTRKHEYWESWSIFQVRGIGLPGTGQEYVPGRWFCMLIGLAFPSALILVSGLVKNPLPSSPLSGGSAQL